MKTDRLNSDKNFVKINRRRFLNQFVIGSAGLLSGCAIPVRQRKVALFRFLQLNDTHADADAGKEAYEKANEKVRWLIAAAASGQYFERPDFVIGIGDLIHGERIGNLGTDLRLFSEMLKPLCVPFYPVVGNHEVIQQEGNPKYEQAYREVFGNDRLNYTFRHGGLLFIVLNNSGACCVGPAIVKARNDWLHNELELAHDVPKIILCHVPLIPLREEAVLAKSFGFKSYMDRDGDTLKIVEEHADSVIAVLSGHLHLTGVVQRNGVYHVSVSGTGSYPCDFACYEVFNDRIHVRVHSLSRKLLTPGTNIHGKPRYKIDYTDADHPTHELYIRGNQAERDFEIHLQGKKRLPSL
ncbi:MAG: metallophosphoesterase [Kiritimatiellae bacterium]|nr:metallophosphoesterase [Kiritimatiellia bacterium]MDD5519850.1 metallophosphoesterase [Kiritimatiellia bacterium]